MPSQGVADVLPKSLSRLLNGRFTVSEWLSEVHVTAVYVAIADLNFSSDDSFIDRVQEANRSLFRSPLYKLLMWVISPAYMVKHAGPRWGTFHRGIKLHSEMKPSGHGALCRLEFQPALVPPLIVRAYVTAVQAALEASGAENLTAQIVSQDLVHAMFEYGWDP